MKNNEYIIVQNIIPNNITEGGSMRFVNIKDELSENSEIFLMDFFNKNLPSTNLLSFLIKFPILITKLLFQKKQRILFNYSNLPLTHFASFEFLNWLIIIFFIFIKAASLIKNHRIIIDIEDLPREQSKALGYKLYITDYSRTKFEKIIFSLADELWFASDSMAKYEMKLLKKDLNYKVVHNSSKSFDNIEPLNIENDNFKFIYAGTMNKERGLKFIIENFIKASKSNENIELHLCGKSGEWIKKRYPSENIKYWGPLNEDKAVSLAKSCDIGLIAYPDSLYFNIILPAKTIFYIMSGLPIIDRNNTETGNLINTHNIGETFKYSDKSFIDALLKSTNNDNIKIKKKNILIIQKNFLTKNVLKSVT
ncbi:MAG: hypothetical protein ACNFW9_01740 [Candidatus Kerfeldbacteria bacterium]